MTEQPKYAPGQDPVELAMVSGDMEEVRRLLAERMSTGSLARSASIP